ncbi:nuclear receptor subfamily 0 group B member 2-like [Scleropages formosus]|uniref:Nuclear receptor subfamily 0, group B, member 2a n=1 Tax=Scleropages formosus TaxID=113540 RepID=A0A8C9RAV6_SCLFO|nr:nuclear receptor subfamily 0 group B member 2 [Scleropages formosus]
MNSECCCSSDKFRQPNAILFNILSCRGGSPALRGEPGYGVARPRSCPCQARRTVRLKTPAETCQMASGVLVKTVRFMKSLPCFCQLPPRDQLSLLGASWAPLFVVGLAQEGVDFEVVHAPGLSMLKRILLSGQGHGGDVGAEGAERAQPTLAGVHRLKSCLDKFWSLDLSPKEYAYLKGTILFNPDVPELKAAPFIEGLQQEAQRALREVLLPLHPEDHGRFARILLAASTLKAVTPDLVTELFFRPLIGQTDLPELLADMLFSQ